MSFVSHLSFTKKMNPAAFTGKMPCPHIKGEGTCGASRWKFEEQISPFRIRFRCKSCGRTVVYDYSFNPDMIAKMAQSTNYK